MALKHFVSILLLSLISNGCNEYAVKTTINSDGSFERTVICEGDSSGLTALPLPFVFTDGWSVTSTMKDGEKKTFITTAIKKYADENELQTELAKGRDSLKLNLSCRIENKFRWFFTYITYEERIPAYGIFKQVIPVDRYFSKEELARLQAGSDTLLKKRFDDYWMRNIVEGFIEGLIGASAKLNDSVLAPSRWETKRSLLSESILESNGEKTEEILMILQKHFHTASVLKLRGAVDSLLRDITEKVEMEGKLGITYKNEVVMPSLLITSNAGKIEGNKLIWHCSPDRFFEVVMTAESRTVNLWAVIVTSILCAALLLGLLVPMIRIKKNG